MSKDEEIGSWSGIVAPSEVKDADEELKKILKKFEEKVGIQPKSEKYAEISFPDKENGKLLSELQVEGFFTMAYPNIFIYGSCDLTVAGYRSLSEEYFDWVEHI